MNARRTRRHALGALASLPLFAVLATSLVATPAEAAKGGNHGTPPPSSTTWTAPWATQADPTPVCTGGITCTSATPSGELHAVAGPVTAGVAAQPTPYVEDADVVLTEALNGTTSSRTYTATVVLHDVSTTGAGYASFQPRLLEAPSLCQWNCSLGGGIYIASGDGTITGDRVLTVTFTLALDPYSALTTLPPGSYRIGFGVRAGIAESYQTMILPMPCMTDGCQLTTTAHWGVGSADVAATVEKVVA